MKSIHRLVVIAYCLSFLSSCNNGHADIINYHNQLVSIDFKWGKEISILDYKFDQAIRVFPVALNKAGYAGYSARTSVLSSNEFEDIKRLIRLNDNLVDLKEVENTCFRNGRLFICDSSKLVFPNVFEPNGILMHDWNKHLEVYLLKTYNTNVLSSEVKELIYPDKRKIVVSKGASKGVVIDNEHKTLEFFLIIY
ncbi:hypothetical protein [Reichenbachiella ulvae]|uniref:DKNYY family protein n=1 Tax=Reichenbachiella ulvae TaxID=2980104 RepID=A0ABT3D0A4_9BACT|nr:hypothetical protein [Reichenbachiella ulvae]MCV9389380.1 hypothetical protein [Reichenbachiella ulvae]